MSAFQWLVAGVILLILAFAIPYLMGHLESVWPGDDR